jgi:hypothetical protein
MSSPLVARARHSAWRAEPVGRESRRRSQDWRRWAEGRITAVPRATEQRTQFDQTSACGVSNGASLCLPHEGSAPARQVIVALHAVTKRPCNRHGRPRWRVSQRIGRAERRTIARRGQLRPPAPLKPTDCFRRNVAVPRARFGSVANDPRPDDRGSDGSPNGVTRPRDFDDDCTREGSATDCTAVRSHCANRNNAGRSRATPARRNLPRRLF